MILTFLCILSQAKVKNGVSRGLPLLQVFDENDFIIALAGSNDVHHNEYAQLTVTQGTRHLLSLDRETNILVNHIPYQYNNNPMLNDRISFCTKLISKMVHDYLGNLNVSCEDINSVLQRSHFMKHGLHYSRRGKQFLGDHMTNFMRGQSFHPT